MSFSDAIEALIDLIYVTGSIKKDINSLQTKKENKFQFDRGDFFVLLILFLSILAIALIILFV